MSQIHLLDSSHITPLAQTFAAHNWPKPQSLFKQYMDEQQAGARHVWVASIGDQIAGYITLKWQSNYEPFCANQIPEIMDLNVLPPFRNQGIGSKLLETAETEAFTKSKVIGIGVGLYGGDDGGYGPAQKLYVNLGYVPDGRGVTYNYQPVIPGNSYPVDDDLILWFTKKISAL